MKTEKEICSRCILDSNIPYIAFDKDGICNYCHYYDRLKETYLPGEEGEKKLDKIIEKIKMKRKRLKNDCIVGVSGGMDSTYAVYLIKKKYGLRPLAVHFDNGWNSEIAMTNIKKMTDILAVELHIYTVDYEEFKELQLSLLRASVPDVELLTDYAILKVLYKTASENKIKFIITGDNFRTEGIIPRGWTYYDDKYFNYIFKKYSKVKINTYPKYSLFDRFYYSYIERIKLIRVLNYLEYNRKEVMETLESKLGWNYYGGKHYESIFTRFFQSYILPKKFNIDKRKIHLSALINSGQIKRDEAIDELKKETYPQDKIEEDRRYVIEKLGLSNTEFEDILKLPPKTFLNYPSFYPMKKSINNVLKIFGMDLRGRP